VVLATTLRHVHPVIDPVLVLEAQRGNDRAMEDLLHGLADQLMPLAAALAGPSGEADALVQDGLTRVYERIGQLREPAAVLSWARRAVYRSFLDQRRFFRRRPQCRLESVTIATAIQIRPELIDLREAVSRLPREDRALLVMHYWEGLTLAECADELRIPPGTLKSRLNRALSRLRSALGGHDG
jgi:RNA polymerase sigma factor (sigma-70 family)